MARHTATAAVAAAPAGAVTFWQNVAERNCRAAAHAALCSALLCRRYETLFSDTIPEERERRKQDDLQDRVRALILSKQRDSTAGKGKAKGGGSGDSGGASSSATRGMAAHAAARTGRRPAPHRLVNPISTMGAPRASHSKA